MPALLLSTQMTNTKKYTTAIPLAYLRQSAIVRWEYGRTQRNTVAYYKGNKHTAFTVLCVKMNPKSR